MYIILHHFSTIMVAISMVMAAMLEGNSHNYSEYACHRHDFTHLNLLQLHSLCKCTNTYKLLLIYQCRPIVPPLQCSISFRHSIILGDGSTKGNKVTSVRLTIRYLKNKLPQTIGLAQNQGLMRPTKNWNINSATHCRSR